MNVSYNSVGLSAHGNIKPNLTFLFLYYMYNRHLIAHSSCNRLETSCRCLSSFVVIVCLKHQSRLAFLWTRCVSRGVQVTLYMESRHEATRGIISFSPGVCQSFAVSCRSSCQAPVVNSIFSVPLRSRKYANVYRCFYQHHGVAFQNKPGFNWRLAGTLLPKQLALQ